MTCFMIFFYFSENFYFEKFKRFAFAILVVGFCADTLRSSKMQILRPIAIAQMLLLPRM